MLSGVGLFINQSLVPSKILSSKDPRMLLRIFYSFPDIVLELSTFLCLSFSYSPKQTDTHALILFVVHLLYSTNTVK
jgi:hypothetical protein